MKRLALCLTLTLLHSHAALAQSVSFDFLGSNPSGWTSVFGALPQLDTTSPGSIADNPGSISNNGGRFLSSPFRGDFQVGDVFQLQGSLRSETQTVLSIGFVSQLTDVFLGVSISNANGPAQDSVALNSISSFQSVLTGANLGGAIFSDADMSWDLTYTIETPVTATVTGSISDDTGVIWNTPVSVDLDFPSGDLFPLVFLQGNDGIGSLSNITQLSWTGPGTVVPEPSVYGVLAGLALLGFGIGRKHIKSKALHNGNSIGG